MQGAGAALAGASCSGDACAPGSRGTHACIHASRGERPQAGGAGAHRGVLEAEIHAQVRHVARSVPPLVRAPCWSRWPAGGWLLQVCLACALEGESGLAVAGCCVFVCPLCVTVTARGGEYKDASRAVCTPRPPDQLVVNHLANNKHGETLHPRPPPPSRAPPRLDPLDRFHRRGTSFIATVSPSRIRSRCAGPALGAAYGAAGSGRAISFSSNRLPPRRAMALADAQAAHHAMWSSLPDDLFQVRAAPPAGAGPLAGAWPPRLARVIRPPTAPQRIAAPPGLRGQRAAPGPACIGWARAPRLLPSLPPDEPHCQRHRGRPAHAGTPGHLLGPPLHPPNPALHPPTHPPLPRRRSRAGSARRT
jgi:hypothetical protein